MRARLLIAEPGGYSGETLALLQTKFDLAFGPLERAKLLETIGNYDAILVRLNHRLDRAFFEAATRLRILGSPTTGLNHIDMEAAEERGVQVISLQGERRFLNAVYATAEHTWALTLALIRKIPAATRAVNGGTWNRGEFIGTELKGKTLGIVGYGRLGSKVARIGRCFGMDVIAHDPYVKMPSWVQSVSLAHLAQQADVLTVHVSYSESTRGLIGREILSLLKPACVLINTSRGEVIDEEALMNALSAKKIRGAALDVLSFENSDGDAVEMGRLLRNYASQNDNLLITPHIGGATHESMRKTEHFVARKMVML